MKKMQMLEIRGLNEIEREVYLYSCSYQENGLLLTNDQIADKVGISIDYLLEVLDGINAKMNRAGSYYSD